MAMLGSNISVTVPKTLATAKVTVQVMAPGQVTVALVINQHGMTLALLATLLVDEERKVFADLAVPETLVAMAVAVMAHLHLVMTNLHAPLHPEDQGDRLETLGILVLVPNPV